MISTVILTKNEEKNILDCLESVAWTDEIIIIDDYSTDLTEQVVKHFKINKKISFFKRRLEENFAAQRNFGLLKARYEWVLFIDADERVSQSLREEINNILIDNKIKTEGFFIPRIDVIWGKSLKHGEAGKLKLLRLGRKNSGKWKGNVHEVWQIENNTRELESDLIHFPHQTISEFLREINFYTDIKAKELYDQKIKPSSSNIILYPVGKFILNFIFKKGFLDGLEGLVYAIIMSFHSFLVRAKLWLLWQKS